MKRTLIGGVVCFLVVAGLAVAGCSQSGPKAATSGDAIEASKSIETVQARKDYLIAQAQSLYNSQKFQDAVDVAQHVLRYIDKDSQEAKDLLEKAKDALAGKFKEMADTTTANLKDTLGGLGK